MIFKNKTIKLLFISTILFIIFSFSPISTNFNGFPSVSKIHATISQQQLDQTANILSSIQSIINKLKIDIQTLFGREARAAVETIGLVRQDCAGYSNCFTSLSAWEAAYGGITFGACAQGDLVCADKVAIAQIDGAWTSADTTAVTIDGWTTDATHYIRIYTTAAARHQGKWDTGRYRLTSSLTKTLKIMENVVRIEGLQIYNNYPGGSNYAYSLNINPQDAINIDIRISNAVVRSNDTVGIYITGGSTGTVKVWNTVVYNDTLSRTGIAWEPVTFDPYLYLYNNTVYNFTNGIIKQAGNNPIAKNNIVNGNTTDYSGAFDASSSNNISQDATSPNVVLRNKIVPFVDATNKDFHLSSSDTSAKDAGTNLSADANLAFSDDIDGNTRPVGSAWDIGADEESTVAPPPPSDTTPPVLSSGSPTGALPAGTTQTTLSIEATDASSPVSCKYSQTQGTAYSSMTETLSTANGTTFTATVTGLRDGTSYNYYVRCSDSLSNVNTTDYTISFSVATPAGDTTLPTVSITSPTNGTTVSGTITISANAADNVAVAGVQFKLDTTTNLGTEDTISPYSYSLNTTTITDGSHTLTAVARDTSNNYATSSVITITVNNASPPPPDTQTPSIPTGLTATPISSSQINLSWTASTDNVGVAGYKIYRCAGSACAPITQIATSATNSYSNTGLTASTAYTYAVSAYDAAGNESGKSTSASATTQTQTGNIYYVCDTGGDCGTGWNTGNDTNPGDSKSAPLKTIKTGIGKLTPGDTLLVGNGIYTGINNMISTATWNYDIPSGTPGNYITIKAENYLGAVIDGQELYRPVHIENEFYLVFENFYFKNSESANGGANFRADRSNHIKVLNTGSEEGGHAHFWFRYSSYILVEDSFAFGRGTYYFAFVGSYNNYADSQYNVCRRCVARLDYHHYLDGGNWFAPFVSYWSDNTHFQNSISIDGIENPPGDSQAVIKGFYIANGGSNYSAEGSIILNEDGRSAYFESGSPNVTLKNNVMWGKVGGYIKCCTGGANAVFDNNTMGMISGTGEYDFGIYGDGNLSSVKNNLFYGIKRYALTNVQNNAYNSFYLNGGNYWYGASGGIGEITNVDPLVSGLKYLPRIEDGSFLKTAGENGGQIGSQIMKRIGVSRTLYGEPGWNTLTNEDLWPFPNEGKIKEKMSAYNLHSVNGVRGFAAAGTGLYGGPITLTSYIWEYLGNPCPAGICVAISDTTPPTFPQNLTATAVSSSQINLSWTASTDDVGVAGYKIYRCAGSACAPTVQIATSAVNSYSDTGLTASTAYTYAVLVYDAAGNESVKSFSVSATTLASDTTPPTVLITSPTSGQTVSGTITVSANASDNVGVSGVQFKLDNINLGAEDTTSPYSISWNTVQTANGAHTLLAIARDASGNRATSSPITITINNDTTPPTISSIISTTLASTTARINWTTNEPATSQVEYGFTTQYGASTTLSATLTTSHSVLLSNLSPDNTTYNFRVRSKDSSGNEAISTNNTFITPGLTDVIPPASTTNLTANNITQTSVDLVTWTAAGDDGNQGTASSFDIRYATGELSENTWNNGGVVRATGEPTPKPAGSIMNYTLVGLTPNTTYKVALKTLDEILNQSLISNIITFTTLVAQTTPPTPTLTPAPSSGGGGGGGGGSFILTDSTPPPQITDLESEGSDKQTRLTWKNPESSDWVRTIIVRKEWTFATSSSTSSPQITHATSTKDGQVIYEGTANEFTDAKLKNNQTYYYSIFTIDRTPNYSSPATTTVKTIEGKMTAEIERKELTPQLSLEQTTIIQPSTPSFTIKKGFFKRILKQGMKGKDVKKLQEILFQNKEELYDVCKTDAMPNDKISTSNKIPNPKSKIQAKENIIKCSEQELITSYFGKTTKLALIKFQEKYEKDILTPNKLKQGTGILGKTTVKKIEEIYGKKTEKKEIKKEVKRKRIIIKKKR